ncbi:InlB B-repeat-containing protein [Parolsenella catena]|uniref:InlB B-repeat-containing protein n=1 Tax=Parolsenella catena TaxID=2003188 RepID=UPI0030775573
MRVPDRRGHWAVRGWRVLPALLVVLLGAGLAPNVAVADDAVVTTAETSAATAEASTAAAETAATTGDAAVETAEAPDAAVVPQDAGSTVSAASITNARTGVTYDDLATAVAEAKSGDTIKLGEGNYTLYGVSSEGSTKGKNLTFVGQGTDKTAWNIGAKVPNPDNFGTEYNGDYSFDGAGTVTFKDMTMRSGSVDYLGFIRANKTVLDHCVVNGETCYWGYDSAEFKNTTFNAPKGRYALWTYSSKTMTFDSCTFNADGRVINVYTDYSAGSHDIYVNVNNCTFNSAKAPFDFMKKYYKQALNINDSNMGNYKYILNITGCKTGKTTVTAERDNTTCSQLFGFGGKAATNNTTRTDVTIDGVLAWSDGKMQTHSYTDGEQDQAYDVVYGDWSTDGLGTWTREVTKTCKYCGYKGDAELKAYDVSYDLNGSTDAQDEDYSSQTQNPDGSAVTLKGAPVRAGYVFMGWNTEPDGSGTMYASRDELTISGAPVKLYAQWKKEAPENPETPSTPTTPSTPAQGSKPSSGNSVQAKELPQTGDANSAVAPVALAVAAIVLVGAGVLVRARRDS